MGIFRRRGISVALDGKTIRSTGKMGSYNSSLHIVSAQLCEPGIALASKSVDGKSNEIPAVQELLKELDINGCMIVADALNCQKKTAKAVIDGKGDYLLSVKSNQESLETDIADYVQDPTLQKGMDKTIQKEKNRGRIEKRTAFVTDDVAWLPDRQAWPGLRCIGAIHTEFEERGKKTSEWHYYISKQAADCIGAAASRPDGMGGRIHALAAGCSLLNGGLACGFQGCDSRCWCSCSTYCCS